jgi:general secretion pathway protein J
MNATKPRFTSSALLARRCARGFTLIEVMVALMVMAVLATMAWQGVDAMVRSRDISRESVDRTLRLSAVLGQWEADLAAIQDTAPNGTSKPIVPTLRFDGAQLQLVRRAPSKDGVQIVVWNLREGQLRRWASPTVTSTGALFDHWVRSQQLLGNEPEQTPMLDRIQSMQVYFFQSGSWSNAQSTGNVNQTTQTQQLPDGLRVVWTLDANADAGVAITRDIRLPPRWP